MRVHPSIVALVALCCAVPATAADEWKLTGGVTVRVCVTGQCAKSQERFAATLLLDVDEVLCQSAPPRVRTPCGAYRVVRGGEACRPGSVTPDEVGVVVAYRRRWLFEPTNLDEISAALRGCVPGGGFELRGYRHRFRLRGSGRKLRGTGSATLLLRLTLRERVLDVRSRAAYRARPPL